MKRILGTALFIAVMGIGTQAQEKHQTEQGKEKGKREWRKKSKDELNLSADQKVQMKSIQQEFKTQASAIKADKSLSEEQKKQQLKNLHARRTEKVKAILTPEQQQKVAQHRKPNRKHHKRSDTFVK